MCRSDQLQDGQVRGCTVWRYSQYPVVCAPVICHMPYMHNWEDRRWLVRTRPSVKRPQDERRTKPAFVRWVPTPDDHDRHSPRDPSKDLAIVIWRTTQSGGIEIQDRFVAQWPRACTAVNVDPSPSVPPLPSPPSRVLPSPTPPLSNPPLSFPKLLYSRFSARLCCTSAGEAMPLALRKKPVSKTGIPISRTMSVSFSLGHATAPIRGPQ